MRPITDDFPLLRPRRRISSRVAKAQALQTRPRSEAWPSPEGCRPGWGVRGRS